MPRIISRYIVVESLHYFAISLFAFTALLLTLRMIKFASLVINKGVEFTQIAKVFLAIIPTFLEIAIPLSALLGVMLAFARLSGDSEIVVLRASGISLKQLVAPIFVLGIILYALCTYVSLSLKPTGYQILSRSLFEIARSRSTAGLSAGIFNNLGKLTLYSDEINHYSGKLVRVLIDDRREKDARKLITAKAGLIRSREDRQLILFYLTDGQIHEIVNKKYVLTNFVENQLALSMDEIYPSDDSKSRKRARAMSMSELRAGIVEYGKKHETMGEIDEEAEKKLRELDSSENRIESPRRIAKRLKSMEIELAKRFSMPFAAFILTLLAMPLGIQPPRTQKTWGAALSASLGMLVFVLYYGFLSVGVALAENGTVSPVVGVWLPNIVCTLLATALLWKVSTEQWQSIGTLFDPLFSRIGKLFSRGGVK